MQSLPLDLQNDINVDDRDSPTRFKTHTKAWYTLRLSDVAADHSVMSRNHLARYISHVTVITLRFS